MPVNKNAMTRYKILDDLLSNRYHSYTLDDIVENVNLQLIDMGLKTVTRRCIEKDLAYLKGENSSFFAEVESYSVDVYNGERTVKKRCLRYKDPSFSIFKKAMSNEECYLLEQSLSLLGQFDGLPNLEGLNRLRSNLSIRDKRQIISFTKNPLEHSNILGELFTAISQNLVVEITYHLFNDVCVSHSVKLHPYLLKEYNRRWFLIAAAENDSKLLNFGLERIDKVTFLPEHKYVPFDGDIEEYFDDIIGVTNIMEHEVLHILFWVSDASKDYVATKPIHDSQKHYRGNKEMGYRAQYPHLHGGAFFSIDCKENYELIRELTSFGANLIVLEPLNIREEIKAYIERMRKAYE